MSVLAIKQRLLNAIEQVVNVCKTTVLQDAWARGQSVSVHGWVYSLHDGRVRNMGMDVASPEQLAPAYEIALTRLSGKSGVVA